MRRIGEMVNYLVLYKMDIFCWGETPFGAPEGWNTRPWKRM